MPHLVELTAINWRSEQHPATPQLRVVGEDDLELPVDGEESPAPAAPPQAETYPITVNIDDIREYYPRRRGRSGTRLVFKNGAGRPVTEAYDVVKAKIAALRLHHR
jgi:hypothetical protein